MPSPAAGLTGLVQAHVLVGSRALAARFRSAAPFPHVVIDGFLENALCEHMLREFPAFEKGSALNEDGRLGGKAVFERVRELGPAFGQLDDLIRSAEFLSLIGEMTGISGLLYDPDYIGGGTHENRARQQLSPHVDFNYHPVHGWHRRLNLILYLNPEWKEEWGGALELHADPWRPADDRVESVLPLVNRCVIFETSERSWHGFRAIAPPADRSSLSRRSFAIYLYSKERPAAETAPPHATVYVERPLPESVRPGAILQPRDLETIAEVIVRRRTNIDRLVRREQQIAEHIERQLQLGAAVRIRAPLTPEQVDALGWLVARQDEHLRYLYDREKQFTDLLADVQGGAARLRNAVFARQFLRGGLALTGDVDGYWDDQWVGSRLRFSAVAIQPIEALRVAGTIPAALAGGQDLVLEIDSHSWTLHAPPGPFEWALPVSIESGASCSIQIAAGHCWRPKDSGDSADVRLLSWHLTEIDAGPAAPRLAAPSRASSEDGQ